MYEAINVDVADDRREAIIAALTERIRNLEIALESNRRIGMAIGVLMASGLLTEDAALEQMRTASQRDKLKLRDIAEQVLLTGAMPAA